jgi:cell division septation protein DedD
VSQEEKKGKEKKKGDATRLLGYGLVVMFLMVWVFVLGVLTGRGDMNLLFKRLGLYKTELAARLGVAPDGQAPAQSIPQPEEAHKAVAESEKKPAQEAKAAQTTPAASLPQSKPTDHLASKTSAATSKKTVAAANQEAKRSKGLTPQKPEHDQSLASKLSFQNSLDTPTRKQPKTAGKKEATVNTATIASVPSQSPAETTPGAEKKKPACAYQIKVGSYHSAEEAEKAMADLKKKGIKVSVQQGKDKSGASFVIKTGRYNTKSEAEKVTQKLKEAKMTGQIQEIKP